MRCLREKVYRLLRNVWLKFVSIHCRAGNNTAMRVRVSAQLAPHEQLV